MKIFITPKEANAVAFDSCACGGSSSNAWALTCAWLDYFLINLGCGCHATPVTSGESRDAGSGRDVRWDHLTQVAWL